MNKIILWFSFALGLAAVIGVIVLAFIVTGQREAETTNNAPPPANNIVNNLPPAVNNTEEEEEPKETEETYTNESGYSVTLPPGWTAAAAEIDPEDPVCGDDATNIIAFTDPDEEFSLVLGFRLKGDKARISCRTGVGAGDFKPGQSITVAGKKMQTTNLVYQGDVTEIFLGDEKITIPVPLDGYEITGSFMFIGEQNAGTLPDVSETDQWEQAQELLASLKLSD